MLAPRELTAQRRYHNIMRLAPPLLALSLALGSAFAAENLPDLGESSQAGLSIQQERALGAKIMEEVRSDKNYYEDAEVTDYIQNIGARLVSVSDDAGRDFEFFMMSDNTLNAFALPGANIGVHTGLILAAQSESELAAVLAHEISHVTQRHIARQVAGEGQRQLTSLAALVVAILAARSNTQVAQAAVATAQASAIQSQLDYTREYEREADRVGLQLLSHAKFDTSGMATFFERMQRFNRVYDSNAPQYLRTHPVTTERIADIQNRLSKLPYRQVIDGLDFQLVRAKLRATTLAPKDALRTFEEAVRERAPNADAATRYGFALALLRTHNPARAEEELERARAAAPQGHPMLENLAAQIKREAKQPAAALDIYRQAAKRYPDSRALTYGYVESLLEARQAQQALAFLSDRLALTTSDASLHELQAKTYAQLGKRLLEHQAQAEAYVRRGNLSAAIDQLQIAVKSGDGDFYQQSSAEARLRELKILLAQQKQKGG